MNWKLIRYIDTYIGIPLLYVLSGYRKATPRRTRNHSLTNVRRILLVKFWGIGNLFMMLPSVEQLRRAHPGAKMDLLTLASSREAAERTGAFDGISMVDTNSVLVFLKSTVSTIRELRSRTYDVIIDYEQFARFSALCIALIGGRVTMGLRTAGQHRHLLFNHPVPYDNSIHVTRTYCSLAEAAGAPAETRSTSGHSFPTTSRAEARWLELRNRLGIGTGPYIVFHVGTSENFRERRWPAEYYAVLADMLIVRFEMPVVLTGSSDERHLAAMALDRAVRKDRIVDASGRLAFGDYFNLIRSSRLVVSADTAAVHIASATDVPVVGLYGPNTPLLYGPWGKRGAAVYGQLPCSPCITNFNAKTHNCRHAEGKGACMVKIGATEVFDAVRDMLENRTAVQPRDILSRQT